MEDSELDGIKLKDVISFKTYSINGPETGALVHLTTGDGSLVHARDRLSIAHEEDTRWSRFEQAIGTLKVRRGHPFGFQSFMTKR